MYDWFDVRASTASGSTLASPTGNGAERALHVGPKADLLAPAQRVLVSVVTIGPALEQRVHELQAGGEGLQAYLLDSAGVVALGAVGEALRCLAEEAAAELGWGVSAALSPGSLVGWSLRGQRELCALLPLDDDRRAAQRYCVLEPHKSVSVAHRHGTGLRRRSQVGSVCKYCALQDTCWRRREDPS